MTASPDAPPLSWHFAGLSDVGRVRKDNQDSGYAGPWLLTVCDGVGGAARGDIASLDRDRSSCASSTSRPERRPARPGRRRACTAPTTGSASWSTRTRRSTAPAPPLTVALFDGAAGRHRATSATAAPTSTARGEITQLTKDHTFVQTLIDEGRITEEESRVHPHRNLILKAARRHPRGRARPVPRRPRAPATGCSCCSDGACGVLDDGRHRRHPRPPAPPTTPRSSWSAPASRPAAPTTSPASSPTSSTGEHGRDDATPHSSRCWSAPPPSCRGAAAAAHGQPVPRPPRRRHRRARAGPGRGRPTRIPNDPLDPEEPATPRAPPRRFVWLKRLLAARRRGRPGLDRRRRGLVAGASSSTTSASRTANVDDLPRRQRRPARHRPVQPYETTDVELDRLPDYDAEQVREGIDADDLDDARAHRRQPRRPQDAAAHEPPRHRRASSPRRPDRTLSRPDQPEPSHGLRAPAAPGRGAVPAGARAGRRHRRLRRGRPRRRGRGAGRHPRVRRLAGRAGHRLPRGGPPGRAVRRPGAAARRRRAQRARPGGDPPPRPGLRGRRPQARLRPAAADLDDPRRACCSWRRWCCCATTGCCSGSPTPRGLAAIVLLLLPMLPGIGSTINGARIWIHLGPFSFQPGEVAKVLLVIAFAGYLVLHRDALALAGRRVLFVDLPRGRDLGPILAMWLISLGILVFQRDLGSQPAVLRPLPDHALRRHRAARLAGRRRRRCSSSAPSSAYQLFGHVQTRVDIWLRPDGLLRRRGTGSGQIVESMFGMAWGGLIGRGFGNGSPERIPFAESDFIIGAIGEELGLTAVMAVILLLRPDRRARPARRPGLPRRLRQAGGHRPGLRVRAPGVRRHRRRHQADPAHRPDHAVPVVRRLLPRRQLGDHRVAAPHLRPGPPPGPRPVRPGRRSGRRSEHDPGGEAALR